MTPDGTAYSWHLECWVCMCGDLMRTTVIWKEPGSSLEKLEHVLGQRSKTIGIPIGKIKFYQFFHISVLDFFQFYHMVHVFTNKSLEAIKMCFSTRDDKQQQNTGRQAVAAHPLLTDWNILKVESCYIHKLSLNKMNILSLCPRISVHRNVW